MSLLVLLHLFDAKITVWFNLMKHYLKSTDTEAPGCMLNCLMVLSREDFELTVLKTT